MVRVLEIGRFASSPRTTSLSGVTRLAGSPSDRTSRNIDSGGTLPVGEIDKLEGPLDDEAVLARLRDTDDLHPGPRAVVQTKTLADRILPGPVALRDHLVHDGDLRRAGGIGRAEPASFENRQPDRVEVVLVHDRSRDGRAVLARRELEAFRNDRDRRGQTVHRHVTGQRGRLDARDAPGLFGHTLEEPLPPATRCNAAGRARGSSSADDRCGSPGHSPSCC